MATATLSVHTQGDQVVDFDELPADVPQALGPRHRPVAHRALAQTLRDVLDARGMERTKEEWALGKNGARMFGVMTVQPKTGADVLCQYPDEMTAAIGIRHANDMSEALKLVAGMYVFVCSNLSMYGQGDAAEFRKLHTAGLNLEKEIDQALERTFQRFAEVNGLIERFKETDLSTERAKQVIYDAFTSPESPVPNRLFPDVHRFYFLEPFKAQDPSTVTDIAPRSLWGVSNAFTRAIREQPIGRQVKSSVTTMKVLAKVLD